MTKRNRRERQLQDSQQNRLQQGGQQRVVTEHRQVRIAPLPTPEELAQFDAVVPGLAERIVRMAEENGIDRRRNNRAIRWVTVLGQIFAFVVVMTALAGGFYLVNQGQDAAGIAAIITAIGAPLGVFAYNKVRRKS